MPSIDGVLNIISCYFSKLPNDQALPIPVTTKLKKKHIVIFKSPYRERYLISQNNMLWSTEIIQFAQFSHYDGIYSTSILEIKPLITATALIEKF